MFSKKPTGAVAAVPKDYVRVCKSCGARWLLPKEWAIEKAPNDRQVRALERATRFAIGRQRERYSMQSTSLHGSRDRVLANARCPSCGSSDYEQYGPGQAPPPRALAPTPQSGVAPSAAPEPAPDADVSLFLRPYTHEFDADDGSHIVMDGFWPALDPAGAATLQVDDEHLWSGYFYCRVAGARHHMEALQLHDFHLGSRVHIRPQADNPVDHDALAVCGSLRQNIEHRGGYIPKALAAEIGPAVRAGTTVRGLVVATLRIGERRVGLRIVGSVDHELVGWEPLRIWGSVQGEISSPPR